MRDFELVFANNLSGGYSLNFYFHNNPYFENQVLTKFFESDVEGSDCDEYLIIPIEWKNKSLRQSEESTGKKELPQESFFAWYNDYNIHRVNTITKIMKEELWYHPLRFYLNKDNIKTRKTVGCSVSEDKNATV